MAVITGISSKMLNTRVKNIPFCLALDSVRRAFRMPHLSSKMLLSLLFSFLVLRIELSLKQFSLWAPGLYPRLSDFCKCSLSEWRHHFPTSLTFSMIHLFKCLVYTDMISWAWWCMHLDLWHLKMEAGGPGVHSQVGCYIRAVSKAKGQHRKQTAHVTWPLLLCYHVVCWMSWFTCRTPWHLYLDLVLHFT